MGFDFGSVPWNKDAFCLQSVLSSHNLFGEYVSIMRDNSLHIVDQEWLGEVIFVVRIWHGLEVEGHSGSTLNITEFVHTGCSVSIGVEKLSSLSSVLWEVSVVSTLVPFLIVVNNVISLWREELSKSWVGKNSVENVNFINSWFSTLVSNSGSQTKSSAEEMDFPDESLRSHEESKGSVSEKCACPSVVRSMESAADLVEIITSSHSIFPVIVLENIATKSEFSWISLSLSWLKSTGTSESRVELKEVSVISLRWIKSLVVELWVSFESSTVNSSWWSLGLSSSEASCLEVDHLSLYSLYH